MSRAVRVAAWLLLACCWIHGPIPLHAQQRTVLVGSGSSLAGSLLGVWGQAFNRQYPAVHVGYVATTSSEGIEQVSLLHEDFAIGEIPLTARQKNSPGTRLAQLPIAVVSIVPVYNLPGQSSLRFTGEVLAQIYMGRISYWNDERITRLNPGVQLPNVAITLVQRPEGTGSRYLFTEFLTKTSPEFRRWMKNTHRVEPTTVVEVRSQGMANRVASTLGAFGFVDYSFALRSGLEYGQVQNSSGKFVKAAPASVRLASTAMQQLVFMNSSVPPLDAPGENSYPLTGFVWVYLPVGGMAPERASNLYEFLSWCLGEGQNLVEGHVYDRLPASVANEAQARLHTSLR